MPHTPQPLLKPARRLAAALAVWALGAPALPALAAGALPAAAVQPQDVQVVVNGPVFSVDVVMHAPVPPAEAFAVLTDFEHMNRFVPNLQSSQVLERSGTVLRVQQKGVARFGPLSKGFESVREVRLAPPREIRVHGLSGSVNRMDSLMQLQPEPGGTRLQYHAEVEPGGWMPPLIGPSLVQHETAEQFTAILQEMLNRH